MWPCHPPVLAKVWWHNLAWWPSMVELLALTLLLELAVMAADMGPHDFMLLREPA